MTDTRSEAPEGAGAVHAPPTVREGRLRYLLGAVPELYRPQPINELLGLVLRIGATLAGAEDGFAAALPDDHLLALRSGVEGMADLSGPVGGTPLLLRAARGALAAGGGLATAPEPLRGVSVRALFSNEIVAEAGVVAVPLRLGLHPLGVLALRPRGAVDPETLELLATQASHALQNLVLYASDSGFLPTGYRYLTLQRLLHALRSSHRRGEPCAVVHVEVAGMDATGPRAARRTADWVVHHLANGLRAAVRDTDVVGRTGPAAFLLVLPSTPAAGAEVLVRRLRDMPRRVHVGTLDVEYEVAVGVAALPPPADPQARVGAAALTALAERLATAARGAAGGAPADCAWTDDG